MHQMRQRLGGIPIAVQGIGDEPADIAEPEGRQHDLLHPRSGLADRGQRSCERVRRTDLVVAVGPDQHQVPYVRIGNQVLQQFKGCRVQPLQIVEEQRERVLLPGECPDELSEHQLETVPRVLWRQIGNRRLFPDDELHLRDEIDHELAIRTQCFLKNVPPLAHLRFTLDEDLTDQSLEGLCQGRVGDVALVLVEFAGCEEPARRNKHLVQLIHHGRFADTGITRDQHQFRCAVGHDPVESRQQSVDLAFPPVQLFRDQQTVRHIVQAEQERIDATMRPPFPQAPPKIGFQTRSSLVAFLGVLGQELHRDRRQWLGDGGSPVWRSRLARNVAVDPLQRVSGGKRQRARKHLVQGDSQRVEIAAGIDGTIHAASLLGRHVGEGAGNDLDRYERLALVWQLRRNPEAGEPDVPGIVDEYVRRLDVLMDEAVLMDLAELLSSIQWRCAGTRVRSSGCPWFRSRTRSSGSPPGSLSMRIVRPS